MNTLRFRLIGSYVVLLLLALLIMAGGWWLFLRTTDAFDRLSYLQLTANAREALQAVNLPTTRQLDETNARRYALALNEYSTARVLLINRLMLQNESSIIDSAVLQGTAPENDFTAQMLRRVLQSQLGPGQGQGQGPGLGLRPGASLTALLRDSNNQPWLGVALNLPNTGWVAVFVQPRGLPNPLLQEVVIGPLLQAALLGLGVAIIFTVLLSRWVLGPMTELNRATQAMAAGELNQQVPITGPTEMRTLAQSFNYMAHRVQQSQQVQRDFVANVSHELKTPLTSIQGFSQALLDGTATDPTEIAKAAQVIHTESGRMERLVSDLLDLARFDSGQPKINLTHVELGPILTYLNDQFTPLAHTANVTLHVRVEDPLPTLLADGDRLMQVFSNLLDNALKHSPPGSTITLLAQPANGGVQVSVHDQGPGIPPEAVPRIFERFYQADISRQAGGGTGIGLAVTKEIIGAHNGRISVASQLGQGSVFTLWLPAAK